MNMLSRLLSAPIYVYRWTISPMFPSSCRYHPTCSSYALEALKKYGAMRGGYLALRRIIRCHPWGGHGYDPVPSDGSAKDTHKDRVDHKACHAE